MPGLSVRSQTCKEFYHQRLVCDQCPQPAILGVSDRLYYFMATVPDHVGQFAVPLVGIIC